MCPPLPARSASQVTVVTSLAGPSDVAQFIGNLQTAATLDFIVDIFQLQVGPFQPGCSPRLFARLNAHSCAQQASAGSC